MRFNPDYGGPIPDVIDVSKIPDRTNEQYILDRIGYYKNNDHLSDMVTVQQLLLGRVVGNGRDGWWWLKRWYEEKQQLTEKTYRALMGDIGKSIDNINGRLKEFDR